MHSYKLQWIGYAHPPKGDDIPVEGTITISGYTITDAKKAAIPHIKKALKEKFKCQMCNDFRTIGIRKV